MALSRSFKGAGARGVKAHLLRGSGHSGELRDLRGDVDEAFQRIEAEVDALGGGGGAPADPPQSVIGPTFSVAATTEVVLVDASLGPVTVSLLAAASYSRRLTVKKTDSSSNVVVLLPSGVETIDGQATAVINAQYDSLDLVSDNSNYWIV